MMLDGRAVRDIRRAGVSLGLLVGAMVAPETVPLAFAQQGPRQIRRHLERQAFDPTSPHGPYLGQAPPGMTPKVFAPGFVSTEGAAEYSITFSPDGNEIYFSRYTLANGTDTTWVTRQVNGAWTLPAVAEFAGGIRDTEAFITPDGRRMYFVRQGGSQNSQICFMDRGATGWTVPVRLGSPFSVNSKMYPTTARNGNLYFTEEVNSTTRRFFGARAVSGGFDAPTPLGTVINAYNSMGHSFIAADESFLVFDAAPDGQSYFLQVSFKGSSNDWLPPARLNDGVNVAADATCPTLSPDEKYLFFHRGGDIWWVDASVVFDLDPAHKE